MTGQQQLRVALYARVSQANDGGQTTSVDEQLATLRALAERHGGTVVAEHTDRAISASGAAKRRPGWDAVLAAIRAGQVDAVGLWEVSRSSRRLTEWAGFRDLCREHSVVWLTPSEGVVDPNGSRDRLGLGVKAVVAEEEAAQTSDRIRRTVRAKAAEGRPHGKEVYGYRRVYDPRTGRLAGVEVEPSEAAVLRRIVAAVLDDGTPLRTLGRQLDAEGIPCPSDAIAARRGREPKGRTWTSRVVRDLLRSRTYVGVRVHRERDRFNRERVIDTAEHPAGWEPLWTEDEHARLVALLDDPARHTRPPDVVDVRHWLSGVLRCAKCEGRMRFVDHRVRGSDRRSRYYQCMTRGCRGVVVDQSVEDMVAEVILARLTRPDALPALTPNTDQDTTAAREVLAAAEQRLDDLAGAYADGAISLAAFTAAEQRLRAQVDAARATLAESAAPELPEYARGLADPAAAWEVWTPAARQRVAYALLRRVLVRPTGRTGRPAKGARPVAWSRLGFDRRGTDTVVWGVDDPAEAVTA